MDTVLMKNLKQVKKQLQEAEFLGPKQFVRRTITVDKEDFITAIDFLIDQNFTSITLEVKGRKVHINCDNY